ncbi:hypothetical protein K2X30_07645 [bacterium]|nr:hypothetical protein [bacterium]
MGFFLYILFNAALSFAHANCVSELAKLAKTDVVDAAMKLVPGYRGNLVQVLGKEGPPPHWTISSKQVVSERQTLLQDSEGRTYLVENLRAAPRSVVVDMKSQTRTEIDLSFSNVTLTRPKTVPIKDAKVQDEINELAKVALTKKDPKSLAEVKLDDKSKAALREGAAFKVGGDTGTIHLIKEDSGERLVINLLQPEKKVAVSNELGEQKIVSLDQFNQAISKVQKEMPAQIHQVEPEKTVDKIRKSVASRQKVKSGLRSAAWSVPHTVFFPYAVPYTLPSAGGRDGYEALFKLVRKNALPGVAYGTLIATGVHPTWVVFEKFIDDDVERMESGLGEGLPVDLYKKETQKTWDQAPEGVTLYVDGFPLGNELDGYPYYDFKKKYGNDSNAVYIKVESLEDFEKQLPEITKKHGQISKVEVFGHGNSFEESNILNIGNQLVTTHSGKTPEIDRILELDNRYREPSEKVKRKSVTEGTPVSGYFKKGAVIRFVSCQLGASPAGEKFLKLVGERYLDQGGTAIGSTVDILFLPSNSPPEVRQKVMLYREQLKRELPTRLSAHFAAPILALSTLVLDEIPVEKLDPKSLIREVKIEPRVKSSPSSTPSNLPVRR